MNTKQLSGFLLKSRDTIIRHAKKLGIIFTDGVEKIYNKEEITLIAHSLYRRVPLYIQKEIDKYCGQPTHPSQPTQYNLDENIKIKSNNIAILESLEIVIRTLKDQENRLSKIEQKTNNLIEYDNNYMKLKAFCSKNKLHMNRSEMIAAARDLKKLSLDNKKDIIKVQDDNFGEVNAYHIDVLNLYFSNGAQL